MRPSSSSPECLLTTLLVLTLTMRELRHWPSIANMSLQSHWGDEEAGCSGLTSWQHYIYIYICIYIYMYTIFINISIYTHRACTHMYHIILYNIMYIYIYIYLYISLMIHLCRGSLMATYMYIYIYVYIYVHLLVCNKRPHIIYYIFS